MRPDFRCGAVLAALLAGCFALPSPPPAAAAPPELLPKSQPSGEPQPLDPAQIPAMYTEVLAIDLPTLAQLALDQNLDIQQARLRSEASRGQYESAVGGAFPVFSLGAVLDSQHGAARAVTGEVVHVGFTSLQPTLMLQWVLNPGTVVYDILAARQRLVAAQYDEQSVTLDTLRVAVLRYYDLVLAQARAAAVRQARSEAEETARLLAVRVRSGTAVRADELDAQAALAGREHDVEVALNEFRRASIALALTLRIAPWVTLVPSAKQVELQRLVDSDVPIDRLLAIAAECRPDLKELRALSEAASDDHSASKWGEVAPDLRANGQVGMIGSHASGTTYGLADNHRNSVSVGIGWDLGVDTFARLRTAAALEASAAIDAEHHLDEIQAQVVQAAQDSNLYEKLVGIAHEEVMAAAESLRVAQVGIAAGTRLTIDALHAEDAAAGARVRYAEAVVRYDQAQVELLASLGLLDASIFGAEAPASR